MKQGHTALPDILYKLESGEVILPSSSGFMTDVRVAEKMDRFLKDGEEA